MSFHLPKSACHRSSWPTKAGMPSAPMPNAAMPNAAMPSAPMPSAAMPKFEDDDLHKLVHRELAIAVGVSKVHHVVDLVLLVPNEK